MVKKPSPIPLGMVICDMIIEDKKTGKKSLIGMFSNVSAPVVPCPLNRFGVYISMTEGIGDYTCSLKCVRAGDNLMLGETRGGLKFEDRSHIVEIVLEITGLTIPEYGEYRLEFYCEEELLISRKFTVTSIGEKSQPAQ
jgi:hypothetical protein